MTVIPSSLANSGQVNIVRFREALTNSFNESELQTLCFDLNLDYENLPPGSKADKARELLALCLRTDRLPELIQRCAELRPHISWHSLIIETDTGLSPFKGLQFFTEADADLFFGRERLVAVLVDHLYSRNFLAVVGASGSGKSSLVRAGLVPALRRGQELANGIVPPSDSHTWPVHVIRPTAQPLRELASSLTHNSESVTAATTMIDDMVNDTRSLDLWVAKQLKKQGRDGKLVLIVDQFEEVFTVCKDESVRRAYIENLMTAVAPETAGNLVLIITLRADFYHHCAQYDRLRDMLQTQQKYIGSMTTDELRQAIEKPARNARLHLEEGLVDLLLRDVGNEPGALPLLSHALLETWKRREDNTLTLAGYIESGSVQGAIAKTAEVTYQSLRPVHRDIARKIFLRLIELGENTEATRRRATLDEIIPHGTDVTSVQEVLQMLIDARLVITDQDNAEVAHEALIHAWPTLHRWLEEDRERLLLHRRLALATHNWLEAERDVDLLFRGTQLKQIQELFEQDSDQLNAQEREFIEASQLDETSRELVEGEARKNLERYFITQWTVSTAAGIALGVILANMMIRLFLIGEALFTADRHMLEAILVNMRIPGIEANLNGFWLIITMSAVVGLVTGLAQRRVIRQHYAYAHWWPLANTVGFVVGFAIIAFFDSNRGLEISSASGGIIVGAVVGISQWLGLSRQIKGTAWWPLTTTVGFTAGFAISNYPVGYPESALLNNVVGGIVIGLITGIVLVRILRQYEPVSQIIDVSENPWQTRKWQATWDRFQKTTWGQKIVNTQQSRILEVATIAFTVLIVLLTLYNAPSRVDFQLEEPSPRDVIAPYSLTYTSEVRTEQARQQAASSIPDTGDEEIVSQRREEAMTAVEPVNVAISQGQIIVRESEIITEKHLETLQQLGFLINEPSFLNESNNGEVLPALVILLSITLILLLDFAYPKIRRVLYF